MIGQTISHYTILEKIGEGGMGVVYRAEDTTLKRVVALKFLPPHVNASEMDKARFLLEAQAAASLNHPNICTIYGIEEHDRNVFIAMEFVDGMTLRQKMGALNQKQALDIGVFIAEGLAAAHDKGIVHRDIKPENIMIRKDGLAQIMDFGLAKLRSNSSKINRLTKEGSTVGTAGYMSPEQVQGHDADHRSDIFSLGVVLYELFTGSLPFRGVHETALMYEIVNVDAAPMSTIRPEIDTNLDAIILECLEKEPGDRYQSVAEVAKDLRKFKRESSRARASRITSARPVYQTSSAPHAAAPGPDAAPTRPQESKLRVLPWLLAGIFFAASAAAIGYQLLQKPLRAERTVIRGQILPPARTNFNMQVGGHLALSPDGGTIAFVGTDSTGVDYVWVRPIGSLTAVRLAGTEGATYPFWSHDSKSIGYFIAGKLKRIEATGGPTLTVCDAPSGRGGTWNAAGLIVFAPSQYDGLSKVSAAGGSAAAVTLLDTVSGQRNHRWPHFLPDGRHVIYATQAQVAGSDNDVVHLLDLETGVDTLLMFGNSNTEYASGQLIYHRQGTLMAQPFDTTQFRFSSDAVPIVEQIQYSPLRSRATYAVSRTGVLIYQSGESQFGRIGMLDRAGNRLSVLPLVSPLGASLSHDGKRLAFTQSDFQMRNTDIWIYEMDRGTSTRLTFDPALENTPQWSANDDSIVFSSSRNGRTFDLYIKSTNGTGSEREFYRSNRDKFVSDWSRDGSILSFMATGDPKTKADLWLLPLTSPGEPRPFLQAEFREGGGTFSPDAQWIAYMSDESQRMEVYVRPLDGREGKWQVSVGGGVNPSWSGNGREIYFVSTDRKLMCASVRAVPPQLVTDSVRVLFDFESRGIISNNFEVSADGQRFFFMVTELRQATVPISFVVNWDEEIRKQ